MIKDLLLAIILGALLGFGITGAFLAIRHNKAAPAQNTPSTVSDNKPTTTSSTPTPAPIPSESPNIVINTPENQAIVSNSKINLKGSTEANSLIVVITPIKTYSVKSNSSGNFDLDIDLETGVNLIKVTSINPQDVQSEIQLIVTYSTAKI
jgi:hypothetical protein